MKNLFKYIFAAAFLITGCRDAKENKNDFNSSQEQYKPTENVISDTNKIKTDLYKGMFTLSGNNKFFAVCDTKRKYVIAEGSETNELEKMYGESSADKSIPGIYSELEGFLSQKSKQTGNGMDTVLIITRLIKYNDSLMCR